MCKTGFACRAIAGKRHAMCSKQPGVDLYKQRRIPPRRLGSASSILDDAATRFFYKPQMRRGLASAQHAVPTPASTAPRAREGIKTHARRAEADGLLPWSGITSSIDPAKSLHQPRPFNAPTRLRFKASAAHPSTRLAPHQLGPVALALWNHRAEQQVARDAECETRVVALDPVLGAAATPTA